jgi:hypothetical protein
VKKWYRAYCVLAAVGMLTACAAAATATLPASKPQASDAAGCVTLLEGCGVKATSQSSPHFVIVTGDDLESVAGAAGTLEAVYDGFFRNLSADGFTPKQIEKPLTWVIFADGEEMDEYAEAVDHADTTRLDGYYSPRTNRVAIVRAACDQSRDWEETAVTTEHAEVLGAAAGDGSQGHFRRVSHEAAHQLSFNCGMLTRGVMYPLWVSEGVSTNFECDSADSIKFCGPNKPRAERLASLAKGGRLMSLDRLVRLVQVPACTAAGQDDYYAQAWGLFNFLYNRHRPELKTYLGYMGRQRLGYRDGESLAAEFQRAFGGMAALEADWQAFAAGQ